MFMDLRQEISNAARLDFERLRFAQARNHRSDAEAGSDALPSFLGRVVSSGTNLKAGQFCKVVPSTVLGIEQEGGSGVFADSTAGSASSATPATVFVYLLGSLPPKTGDFLVCRFVDHRWVAETSGAGSGPGLGGVIIPTCLCTVPPSLQMTSAHPQCNYGMFQSCSLSYGPPPPSMAAFGLKNNVFTSPRSFVDPITNAEFYYYLNCQGNQFFLTRIYPTSPYGSPYRDGILYTWVIGENGNTCTPLQLIHGSSYPGSDPTCSVSITGG